MVKRWFLVGMIFLLVPWLLVGCGVAQEEYDAVVAERDAVQVQVASLQSDLAKTESQVETLESDLAKTESRIETLQSSVATAQGQYTAFKSDLNTLWASLDKKLELGAYLITYWAVAGVGDEETLTDMTFNMVKYVDAVENAELSQLWQQAMSYAAQGKEAEFGASFSLLMVKTVELLSEDIEVVEAKLSK